MRSELDAIWSLQRFFAQILPEPWNITTDLEVGVEPVRPFALIEPGEASTDGPPVAQDVTLPVTVNLYMAQSDTREAATDAALALREQVWQAVKWGPDARNPTTDRIPLYAYEPRVEQHRFRLPWVLRDLPFTLTIKGLTSPPILPTTDAAGLAADIGLLLGAAEGDVTGQDRGTRLWDVFYGGALAGQRIGDPAITPSGMTPVSGIGSAWTVLQGAPAPWRGPSDYMRVESFSQNSIRDMDDPTLMMVAVDMRLTFTRTLPVASDMRILNRIMASADSGPGG